MATDRPRRIGILRSSLAIMTLLALGLAACTPAVSSGAFRSAALLETKLKRGVSTKADVQALLGVPNGPGAEWLPALNPDPREIWYYEDMNLSGSTFRMQTVLVFFKGNIYDGYLQTSGTSSAEVKF